MINNYCFTCEERSDGFVGIKFLNGKPIVVFPRGYDIPKDEKECRRDIFKLISVMNSFSDKQGERYLQGEALSSRIPLSSYLYIIQDYLAHGYYIEKETKYVSAAKGKVNWKRTIQQEQAMTDAGNVVYLNFQTKKNCINENNLLTQIHKYCVYQSLYRFGWLFLSSAYLPPKPLIPYNKKLFVSALKKALNSTYNDLKRRLFESMLNIILENEDVGDLENLSIGVNSFEGVWERMIDHVFGEENKEDYFPHGEWYILHNDHIEKSSALEPDTIMKYGGKIYVLDAKYYRFGLTGHAGDLPATSSIQKQITYGKYIAESKKEVSVNNVYNAFVMPFNAHGEEHLKFVSVGTADWEQYSDNIPNYAYVLGILLDTRWIVTKCSRKNMSEIEEIAELIEKSAHDARKIIKK